MPVSLGNKVTQEWDTVARIAERITALGQGRVTKTRLERARRQYELTLDIHYRLKSRGAKSPSGRRFEYSFTACCKYFGIATSKK